MTNNCCVMGKFSGVTSFLAIILAGFEAPEFYVDEKHGAPIVPSDFGNLFCMVWLVFFGVKRSEINGRRERAWFRRPSTGGLSPATSNRHCCGRCCCCCCCCRCRCRCRCCRCRCRCRCRCCCYRVDVREEPSVLQSRRRP